MIGKVQDLRTMDISRFIPERKEEPQYFNYSSVGGTLKFDNVNFVNSTIAPDIGPDIGSVRYDQLKKSMRYYDGTKWKLIGPLM